MRGWTDSTGIFHERNVAESFGERGRIQMASNVSMSVLVAAVCTVGDCGVGVGLPVSPSNDQLLYRTLDGGITWEEFGTLPPSTFIYDVAGDQVLVGDFTNATPGPSYRGAYRWYPSGVTVMPPASLSNPYPVDATSDGIIWADGSTGATVNESGKPIAAPDIEDFPGARFLGTDESGGSFFGWTDTGEQPTDYLLRMAADGQIKGVFAAPTTWAVPVSQSLLISDVLYPDPKDQLDSGIFGLVLLDLETGTMRPIENLIETSGLAVTAFLTEVQTGSFAMVETGGDCLNVRESPLTTAKSLGCFADGVLLRMDDATSVVEGQTWQAVTTPAGEKGWASAEFLVE